MNFFPSLCKRLLFKVRISASISWPIYLTKEKHHLRDNGILEQKNQGHGSALASPSHATVGMRRAETSTWDSLLTFHPTEEEPLIIAKHFRLAGVSAISPCESWDCPRVPLRVAFCVGSVG